MRYEQHIFSVNAKLCLIDRKLSQKILIEK